MVNIVLQVGESDNLKAEQNNMKRNLSPSGEGMAASARRRWGGPKRIDAPTIEVSE